MQLLPQCSFLVMLMIIIVHRVYCCPFFICDYYWYDYVLLILPFTYKWVNLFPLFELLQVCLHESSFLVLCSYVKLITEWILQRKTLILKLNVFFFCNERNFSLVLHKSHVIEAATQMCGNTFFPLTSVILLCSDVWHCYQDLIQSFFQYICFCVLQQKDSDETHNM